jgi:hypothetical protein
VVLSPLYVLDKVHIAAAETHEIFGYDILLL